MDCYMRRVTRVQRQTDRQTEDDLFGGHAVLGVLQLVTQLVDLVLKVEAFRRRTVLQLLVARLQSFRLRRFIPQT